MKVPRDPDDEAVIITRHDGDYYKVTPRVTWPLGLLCNGNPEGQSHGIIFMSVPGYKICNRSKSLVSHTFILISEPHTHLVDINLAVVFLF